MKKEVPLFVKRLRDESVETISERIAPEKFDISDNEILLKEPVIVNGEAYITDDFLLITLSISAALEIVCSFCNKKFNFNTNVEAYTIDIPVEDVRGDVLDLLPYIRELLLVEIPLYPQCGGAVCKNRKEMENFFKKECKEEPKTFKPFENL